MPLGGGSQVKVDDVILRAVLSPSGALGKHISWCPHLATQNIFLEIDQNVFQSYPIF